MKERFEKAGLTYTDYGCDGAEDCCGNCGGEFLSESRVLDFIESELALRDTHHKSLRAKELGEIRERIAEMANPYPVEIFPEPWDGWQNDIDELAKTKGRRIDCISAYYSRWQRKRAKEDALALLDELIEKP
jgi:hypothetical protein